MSGSLRSLCVHVWFEEGDLGPRIVVQSVEPAVDDGDGLPNARSRFATTSFDEARSRVADWLEALQWPDARRGGSRS